MLSPMKSNKDAEAITHTLSTPSKMPCHSYSIPAEKCIVGSKMRDVKDSICSVCYALKGRYAFRNVKDALFRRFEAIHHPLWVEAMVFLIQRKEKSGFFRWHDSGDLQGEWHLENIVEIARRLPSIRFWLPTREYRIVQNWMRENGEFPQNLTVRLSGLFLDGKAPEKLAKKLGLAVSGAHATEYNCPSSQQGGKCLDCRRCWDKNVFLVNYKKH